MDENGTSKIAIDAAIEVHKQLGGPGLLEDLYEEAFCEEMKLRGMSVERQKAVPVIYKGRPLKKPLFLDVIVNEKVIIEVKATDTFNPIFCSQLLTYLRLSGLKLGLVINFGEQFVKNGIKRVVNNL